LSSALDNQVRLHIYERFVADGRPPAVEETAAALELSAADAESAYRRLEQARVIVLAPGTANIWMANPLSAVPSSFHVTSDDGRSWWGNCVWDGLGILAMMKTEGVLDTSCPDCGEAIEFRVKSEELQSSDAVVHFVVPAARWWDNIGFA
jgi:Alkylmercury lyase